MAVFQSDDFVALFQTYTAHEGSIGAHLSDAATQAAAGDLLVVATGTDLALFPGHGAPPTVESFRLSTRGFKELAAVSHLGPALASLVRMHEIDPGNGMWRADAVRLLQATEKARAANSAALWRDQIAVEAYAGREAAIAAMVDYGCALTPRFPRAVLADEAKLTSEHLRAAYLQARDPTLGASVPFNAVMIATFFLTGFDIAFRITRWFKAQAVDWQRAMVLVVGQQGRPTSGVTWTSNSVCPMILSASDRALPLDRRMPSARPCARAWRCPADLSVPRAGDAGRAAWARSQPFRSARRPHAAGRWPPLRGGARRHRRGRGPGCIRRRR